MSGIDLVNRYLHQSRLSCIFAIVKKRVVGTIKTVVFHNYKFVRSSNFRTNRKNKKFIYKYHKKGTNISIYNRRENNENKIEKEEQNR